MLKVTLLGTGTSGGVPSLGCHCEVCESHDSHDKRLRCAALIESETTRVLIDCGPDIRQQLMPFPFQPLDGILLTHMHYDHVGGIDDLRPFCVFGDINIHADEKTARHLHESMPYCFGSHLYPGVPKLNIHVAEPHKPILIGDLTILPIEVMHGKMPILAFRIGDFAYITDMKTIEAQEKQLLQGVKVMVVNALRFKKEHHSHQLVDDAIAFVHSLNVPQAFLTHCTHEIGLHEQTSLVLPDGIRLAYDGLVIEIA